MIALYKETKRPTQQIIIIKLYLYHRCRNSKKSSSMKERKSGDGLDTISYKGVCSNILLF